MKNILILVVLALVVIGAGLFLKPGKLSTPIASSTPIGFDPSLSIPNLADAPVEAQAWGNFQDYLKAAKNHDLESLKKFSYQLSGACSDTTKQEECFQLMDSLVAVTSDFKLSDFKHIDYDDKQVVMSTDYMPLTEPTKAVLYFVRAEDKFPKMLAIRFCYGDESKSPEQMKCVNTDPTTRDKDKNGWWDDVEALFNKKP